MTKYDKKRLIQESLRSLAASHAAAVAQIEKTMADLMRALELDEAEHSEPTKVPLVDETNFCISWQGQSCYLGNTLLFWMLKRLARSPNRYVAHVDLLDDVWHGQRETSTIRGVAKRLRDKLTAAGMPDLAAAIDGGEPGYYGLKLV